MPMSPQKPVPSHEMPPAGTDTGFAGSVWVSTVAVGATSPRTHPRVITAIAITKAVTPIHFNIGVPRSLLAPDRHDEVEHLFPVRRGDVADLEAESRELPGGERLSGKRHVKRLDRLLSGVEPFAAVRGEPEGLLDPRVLELHGPRLVVDVLALRDHQPDAVRLRATPEPERSHQSRRGDEAVGALLPPPPPPPAPDLARADARGGLPPPPRDGARPAPPRPPRGHPTPAPPENPPP